MRVKDKYNFKIEGYSRLVVIEKKGNRITEIYDLGENAIQFRAKYILSRLLGGGLKDGSGNDLYTFGNPAENLRISAIALGNGGHLIYNSSNNENSPSEFKTNASTLFSTGLILDKFNIIHDTTRPAMPHISGNDFGYMNVKDNIFPGATYEPVVNGNVPWDGVIDASDFDNGLNHMSGSSFIDVEAGITLFSETIRIPLDPINLSSSNSGIVFSNKYEVTFKATLPSTSLNYADPWGYANIGANLITEAGLIQGWTPTYNASGEIINLPYSDDGKEPSAINSVKNPYSKIQGLYNNQDTMPLTNFVPDSFGASNSDNNTWNLFSRKTFGAIAKRPGFSLIFIWTIGF
jgi:hypothetical protein